MVMVTPKGSVAVAVPMFTTVKTPVASAVLFGGGMSKGGVVSTTFTC